MDNDNAELPRQITNLNCAIKTITKAEIKSHKSHKQIKQKSHKIN